ncbi:hypothetical protein F5Y03DRAFT_73752 [Xylaria venustula]|nr:hypothetical protein F5Y03DRAFT_73752 [Xylaria venustula]
MALSLTTGAIVAAPTEIPATLHHYGSQIVSVLVSAVRFAGHYQRIVGRFLLPLLVQTSVLAYGLMRLSHFASIQTCLAIGTVAYHSTRLSKQATWTLWNSTQMRRLRKKIEFEFFTLILGAGGNNLCLVIFWPGWWLLGLAVFVLSAWFAP